MICINRKDCVGDSSSRVGCAQMGSYEGVVETLLRREALTATNCYGSR